MRREHQRFQRLLGACSVALALLLVATVHAMAAGSTAAASTQVPPVIEVLSNRADLLSGADALVEVHLPDGTQPLDVRVELDGRDITHEFALRPNGHYQGLVTGLRPGTNQLTAWTSRTNGATITVTNHSQQGPILAGPQVQPWICETQLNGLGPATGPSCVAPTRYDYFYKSTATGKFEPYDAGSPPADALIATTTTDRGKTLPYIVRRERGVIDRGIYDIAVLYQPGQAWEPWAPQPGWNGKLHWYFQGDCNASHRQAGDAGDLNGEAIASVLNGEDLGDLPLSRGWAVAATTLTRLGNNCNDVVSAEIMMMVKEHLTETYGPIRYTTGLGCSGGSLQQHLIANNYPGLLDGLLPVCSWADMLNVAQLYYDCRQMQTYFTNAPTLWADPVDRSAVTGEPDGCAYDSAAPGEVESWFDPTVGCTLQNFARPVGGVSTQTEPDWVYNPVTNPGGVRCTIQDYQERVYGHRATDGFANQPMDNTGLQFGLKALASGRITPEQFVDLNVRIGGRDIDYNPTPQRTAADVEGLRNAYRSGRVNDASQLDRVPIIDLRESANQGHPDVFSRMTRARLIAAHGNADNQVIWTQLSSPYGTHAAMFEQAFLTMDRWLTAIEADHSTDPLAVKVLRHKPVNATDTCWVGTEPGACGTDLPYFSSSRLEAGEPMRMDILKCQLKPIDWNAYGDAQFTDEQKHLLQGAFPSGVCDWTKPGVAQQPIAGTWQTFTDTIGGRPLPPPPVSTPLRRS